jgi:hypothetical protein
VDGFEGLKVGSLEGFGSGWCGVGLKVGSHEGWVLGPRSLEGWVDLDLGFGGDRGGDGAQSGVT